MQSHVALMIEQGVIVLGINTLEHLQMEATHVHNYDTTCLRLHVICT